jgi:hypothetical protein
MKRVLAAGEDVAAVGAHEIVMLREDGTVRARLQTGATGSASEASQARSNQTAEAALDRLDVPEIDRDTDFSVELLDQESSLAERRRARAASTSPTSTTKNRMTLAAGPHFIWLADDRGVWRSGSDGRRVRVAASEPRAAIMVASDRHVVLARGGRIVVIDGQNGGSHTVAELARPATHLAISANGERIAWAVPGAIGWVNGDVGDRSLAVAGDILDLQFCDGALVAALDRGLLLVTAGAAPELRASIKARRLVCPADPRLPWLALDDRILVSSDQGHHWAPLAAPANGVLHDIAISENHLWLASSEGLFTFVRDDAITVEPATEARSHRSEIGTRWFGWMPKISIRAAASMTDGRHELNALALAAFPIAPAAMTAPILAQTVAQATTAETLPAPARADAAPRTSHVTHDADAECLVRARRRSVELAMTEPERARSYLTRAARAAWLPELRVVAARRYGRSESTDATETSSFASPIGIDTVNEIRYEVRATWDLAKLVFATEELAAQTQALHMAELRRDIETAVNRLYFERRQMQLGSTRPSDETAQAELHQAQIEAELDALSGGAFASCLARSEREAQYP